MMTSVEGMYGGLSALADTLNITRIGPMHQAGSDSLLTAQTFFSLVTKHLNNSGSIANRGSLDSSTSNSVVIEDSKYKGELFGMGNNHTKYKSKNYIPGGSGNNNGGGGSSSSASSSNLSGMLGSSNSNSMSNLQYYGNVHYPPQHQFNHSTNNYGFADDFQDLY